MEVVVGTEEDCIEKVPSWDFHESLSFSTIWENTIIYGKAFMGQHLKSNLRSQLVVMSSV